MKLKIVSMLVLLTIGLTGLVSMKNSETMNELSKPKSSIYDVTINKLDGSSLDLHDFAGKKLLIVNVASKCGYTPQYDGLQKLAEKYGDELNVLGVPCNQFMNQEPGSSDEIADFCKKNYGVTFTITGKVDVKGKDQHPLYSWLTLKDINGKQDSKVKWNFQKYLIDENGNLVAKFDSQVEPMSEEITSKL